MAQVVDESNCYNPHGHQILEINLWKFEKVISMEKLTHGPRKKYYNPHINSEKLSLVSTKISL